MAVPAALRWRCRRGAVELDLLLEKYLDHFYEGATAPERLAFQRMLDLPDPELLRYLVSGVGPADREVARIVDKIRTVSPFES